MPEHVLMPGIEIIADGGRRRRWSPSEKLRIPANHKRIYRIMKANSLLLARKYTERPEHAHHGKVVVLRSNLRWCSDGFEFTCWNSAGP
jgi:transposase InsO family protein